MLQAIVILKGELSPALCSGLSSRAALCLAAFILLWILTAVIAPATEKHLQFMVLPLATLLLGQWPDTEFGVLPKKIEFLLIKADNLMTRPCILAVPLAGSPSEVNYWTSVRLVNESTFGHFSDQGPSCLEGLLSKCPIVQIIPNRIFTVIKATEFLGTISALEMLLNDCPDQSITTIS